VRNEQAVQQDVLDELAWDKSLEAADIGVAVASGAATLTGHVRSYAQKRAAEKAAKRVRGVVAVANELEVRLPGTLQRDDTDIAASVAATLEWNVSVPHGVKATVQQGWVSIEGEVDWNFQRNEAERAVRDLLGVRGVTNLIQLRPSVQPKQVKDRIQRTFHRSAQIDAEHINVSAEGGRVTLSGNVRSWSERAEAEHAARAADGVTDVDNQLHVDGQLQVSSFSLV
jgi:osmotically-inducible protein OsmY